MATTCTHFSDLAKEVQPPDKGIRSRTLYNDDRLKVVLFGFAQGEELSEHTASMPAVLQFLRGEASVGLGDDIVEAQAGTWVHMPKGLRHSIQAKTPAASLRQARTPTGNAHADHQAGGGQINQKVTEDAFPRVPSCPTSRPTHQQERRRQNRRRPRRSLQKSRPQPPH